MTIVIIVSVLLSLLVIAAIVFRIYFWKKLDKFEYEFIKTHKGQFVGRFHYDAFFLKHHHD